MGYERAMRNVVGRARPGHPWIFANDILDPPVSQLVPGEQVAVHDPHGKFLGHGYANPQSLITVRMLTRTRADIDQKGFWIERLRDAAGLRERVFPGRTALRVCAGEADHLGGLIIDRYNDVLVVQMTALGVDCRAELVRSAIEEVFHPKAVVRRDDIGVRAHEGLGGVAHAWWGEVPERVAFEENGVRYAADLVGGQKTGFFFDQAENRAWMGERVRGASVLDLYSHLGGWALTALHHGASRAVAVDVSASACAQIRSNAELNGVAEKLQVDTADCKDWLRAASERAGGAGGRFDVVCVDPPAFAKNKKSAGPALGAYKQVNQLAAGLVGPGGLLFTSSCSHHVQWDRFEEAVFTGVRAAGRRFVRVRRSGQAADHPVLPGVPETEYLKHLVLALA